MTFSQRNEYTRPSSGLIEGLTPGAISEIKWVLDGIFDASFREIHEPVHRLCGVYRIVPAHLTFAGREDRAHNNVFDAIDNAKWFVVFDVLETLAEYLQEPGRDEFINQLNDIFRRHYLAFEFRGNHIERVGAKISDAVLAAARGVLRDTDLAGPNDQFLKALSFLSRRPEADEENCVKEAVGAVEGLAPVLLSDHSIVLSEAIRKIGKDKGVHPTLQKLCQNLYAFRGDADGAAHGASGAGHQVTFADAELVLNSASAMIVYIARLYGRGVE